MKVTLSRAIMNKLDFKLFSALIVLAFVIFFAQTRDFGLMFDGLTYSAYSKHMLTTGDWNTLHYGAREYTSTHGIPPLALWIQALIYKTFGSAEYISRIFPATCALLSTAVLFIFTRLRFGLTAAFWASITLITSTRFIKWGTNFYLDGIAGFFIFSGFTLWLWTLSEKNHKKIRDFSFSCLAGILLTAGFMTKGAVAFPFAIAFFITLIFYFSQRSLALFVFLLVGITLPFALWAYLGEGVFYLKSYFMTSPWGRGQTLCFHPWENLYNVWIPWWPIFALSLIYTFKQLLKKDWVLPLMGAAALSLPMALTLNYHYFEHYLTGFYPFAAVLVGVQISSWIKNNYVEKYFKFTFGLSFILAVLLATIAPNVNKQKDYPAMLWVREFKTMPASELDKIKLIIFSKDSAEHWLNLAALLSRTDWQAIGNFNSQEAAIEGSILIVKKGEVPHSSWEKIPQLYVEGFEFYGPKGTFQF
jgi:4-amino-4-deoxy-L-arabinose transferase-like glycosyltransferase